MYVKLNDSKTTYINYGLSNDNSTSDKVYSIDELLKHLIDEIDDTKRVHIILNNKIDNLYTYKDNTLLDYFKETISSYLSSYINADISKTKQELLDKINNLELSYLSNVYVNGDKGIIKDNISYVTTVGNNMPVGNLGDYQYNTLDINSTTSVTDAITKLIGQTGGAMNGEELSDTTKTINIDLFR